jgi:iron complex outermembrane receptor protein
MERMPLRSLFFLSFVLLPCAAAGQAVLRVEVHAGPALVTGARVEAGTYIGLTGADGQAVFRLGPGEYRVRVTHAGHGPAERAVVLRAASDTTVQLWLEPEVIAGEAIIVTTTRGARRLEDEALRVEVVSAEEVVEKLLMTPGDIAMLLNETSGVRVQPLTGSLGGAGVRIQGLSGRYTQLLVDGLPLHGAQSSSLGALQIPPMDLAQVEVIKGPASALYGANALGGVVNLVSRRPDGQREALYNQTSRGGSDALVYWSGPARPLSYTVVGGLHQQDMRDLDDDVWADIPAYRRVTLRPRAHWRDARGSTLLATVGTLWEKREGGTPVGKRLANNVQYRERLETRRLDAGLNGRYVLSDALQFGVRAVLARDRRERWLNTVFTNDARSTALLEGSLQGTWRSHQWLAGASVERDTYSAYELKGFSYRYTSPALFLQDEFPLLDDVVIAGSARADFHSEYGTLVNPRLSVLYRPAAWTVRLSGGTGSFAPGPFTELTEALGLRTLRPLGDLEPERARSISLDVGRLLGPVELNGSLFAARVDDPVQTRAPASNQLEVVNADGPIRTRGAELFARARLGALHALASFAYLDATEADPDSAGRRRDVPLTPRQTAGLVAAWEPGGLGRLAAEAYYIGEQSLDDNPFRARSRTYWLTGLLAEVRLGRTRLFLNAENLLDVRQTRTDPLIRPSRSREGLWVVDVWAPLEGRTFNGGVRVLLH